MSNEKIISIEDRVPKLKKIKQRKTNRKFVLYISFFFLLILVVVYFQSPLSKVSSIEVEGLQNLNEKHIIELSNVTNETSFWRLDKEKIIENLMRHEEISKVSIEKIFPNKVLITIDEYRRIAYLLSEGTYYPILESGNVLSSIEIDEVAADAPLLMNWEKESDALKEMAYELTKVPESIMNHISEIHHTPEDIDPLHITLFMNDGYEVSSTISSFAEKIGVYPSIISQLDPKAKGIIHIDVGSYFEAYHKSEDESNESQR